MTPEEQAELEAMRSGDESTTGILEGIETLADSAVFGFGNEVSAAINAATGLANEDEGFGDAYSRLLDESNNRIDQFSAENPLTSMGLKVAPALATGIASAPKLLGQAPSLLRTGAVATGEAAVYGAGSAREGGRSEGALAAAPYGLIAPGLQAGGGAYSKLFGSKGSRADQIIADSIDASGMDRADVLKALTDDTMLADISPQMRSIAMGVANKTPVTRQAASQLETRAESMTDRVMDSISKANDKATGRLSVARKELFKEQAEKSRPLYDVANEVEIPITPELYSLLKTPLGQRAYKSAQTIAGNERRTLPEIMTVSDEGVIKVKSIPDMKAWDDIKRGFDDVIDRETDNLTGKMTAEGRQAVILKNELLDTLDDINPAYKKARSEWAGRQSVIDAMEFGRKSLSRPMDEVIDMTEKIGKSERDAMLKGLVSDISERVGRRADNTVGGFNFLNNKNARTKLLAILGDDPKAEKIADNIIETISKERGFAQTKTDVLRGSMTEIRKQAEQMLSGSQQSTGNMLSIRGAASEGIKQLKKLKGISDKDANDLAKRIFDPDMTADKLDDILKDYKLTKAIKGKLMSIALSASPATEQANQ